MAKKTHYKTASKKYRRLNAPRTPAVHAKKISNHPLDFSWRKWIGAHQIELVLVLFVVITSIMIWMYGKPKLNNDQRENYQALEAQFKSEWERRFPNGYKLVIVERTIVERDAPLQLQDLKGVVDMEEARKQKISEFQLFFPPIDTISPDMDINWRKLTVKFTDGDEVLNKEAKVNLKFNDYYDHSTFGLSPLSFSFNRNLHKFGKIVDNLYVELIADEGNIIYLLFGVSK